MVRSHRLLALAALPLLLLAACGDDEAKPFQLALDDAVPGTLEVPYPIAVLTGRATGAETLTLRISANDETYTLPLRPGCQMAFRLRAERRVPPVRLEGLDVEPPTSAEVVDAFAARLAAAVDDAILRTPAGEEACVVDLPADREGLWPKVRAATGQALDIRFLIEVLPRARYHRWGADRTPPRLASGGAPPWPGTDEEFMRFKAAEATRWRQAQEAGEPYEPSDPRTLVLPRAGTGAEDVHDFAVLEWPAESAHRFDGRMLVNPMTARDPQTGKPVVLYEIAEPYRDAFEAWTGANVGLPMAIVVDWTVRSAPIVNSALSDNVQITLGSGSWDELQAEARLLTGALGGGEGGTSDALVAVATWRPDGALELLLPLAERVDTSVSLEARGASPAEQATVGRTLRRIPELEGDARDAVDARLAEVLLGLLDAKAAAPLLRRDRGAAVERLVGIAGGAGSDARRVAAVRVLGLVDLASYAASGALADLVDEAPDAVAAAAARALDPMARHDDAAFRVLVRAAAAGPTSVRMAARSSLAARAGDREDELLALTQDADAAVRAVALEMVGYEAASGEGEPPRPALDALLVGLEDEDARVRRTALTVLLEHARVHADALRPDLARIAAVLDDEELEVRSAAAACLGRFGPEILPVVQPYLEADAPRTRAAAVLALQAIDRPSPDVLRRIEAASEDASLEVRLSVAMYVAAKGGDVAAVLPLAREGLASDERMERQYALGIVWMGGAEVAEAAPWLEPLLDADEAETRVLAAAALRRLGRETERSRRVLAEALEAPDHAGHGLAKNLVRQLEAQGAE